MWGNVLTVMLVGTAVSHFFRLQDSSLHTAKMMFYTDTLGSPKQAHIHAIHGFSSVRKEKITGWDQGSKRLVFEAL